ncbi:MAG: hypothetical protein R3C10_27020 [Pirellulales bacterium]
MLFSCAGLIGLTVIAPKYTIRHGNVQRQDEGRWEVWRRYDERIAGKPDAGGATTNAEMAAPEQVGAAPRQASPGQSDPQFRDEYVNVREQSPSFARGSQTGLWLLRGVLVALVVVTTVVWRRDVWRERRRTGERTNEGSLVGAAAEPRTSDHHGGNAPAAAGDDSSSGGRDDGLVV